MHKTQISAPVDRPDVDLRCGFIYPRSGVLSCGPSTVWWDVVCRLKMARALFCIAEQVASKNVMIDLLEYPT